MLNANFYTSIPLIGHGNAAASRAGSIGLTTSFHHLHCTMAQLDPLNVDHRRHRLHDAWVRGSRKGRLNSNARIKWPMDQVKVSLTAQTHSPIAQSKQTIAAA